MLTKKKANNIQNNSNMYRFSFRSKFKAEIFSLNTYLSINKMRLVGTSQYVPFR